MMARLLKSPPRGHWLYEVKYDGFRALAFLSKGSVRLVSRNGKDLTGRFPRVSESLESLPLDNTVLDGEIVALDEKGVSSFQLLQAYELGHHTTPLFYYVFDIPQHQGEDLRALPLEARRARLTQVLQRKQHATLRLSENVEGEGNVLLEKARKLGLEGLIGKRAGSLYEAGRRSGAWIKLKTQREQEFVIGGYTDPSGSRSHFGSILTGVYENGNLIYCGKVGTGFNTPLLESLYRAFQKFVTAACPFADMHKKGRRSPNDLTPAEIRRCHWLKPKLVCQVRFSEWTRDGKLRQPVFLGLRDDKEPTEVIREEAS